MEKGKRGLSGIITVLIIIAIAIVFLGVVWYVIQGVIDTQTGELISTVNCLGIALEITSVGDCGSGSLSCDVTVERKSGGGNITGVRAIITDGVSALSGDGGSLEVLEITTVTATGSALSGDATIAKVAALIEDSSGGTYICDVADEYAYS